MGNDVGVCFFEGSSVRTWAFSSRRWQRRWRLFPCGLFCANVGFLVTSLATTLAFVSLWALCERGLSRHVAGNDVGVCFLVGSVRTWAFSSRRLSVAMLALFRLWARPACGLSAFVGEVSTVLCIFWISRCQSVFSLICARALFCHLVNRDFGLGSP